MKRWFLPLAATLALAAGPPLDLSRQAVAPASMSEGATALDEAFSQEFAEERQPERITLRYAKETWELDWEDWWTYRQGDLDLDGLLGKVRIRIEGVAAAPPQEKKGPEAEIKGAGLPVAWIAGGIGFGVVLVSVVLIWLLTRKKGRRPLLHAHPQPMPYPPPLPPPVVVSFPTHLSFLTGPLAGQSVLLGQGLRLGREQDCHVVLDDFSVSRHHAELVPGPQGWVLRDLGSSNGTSVNEVRIQGETLLRGDETLVFGVVRARLSAG